MKAIKPYLGTIVVVLAVLFVVFKVFPMHIQVTLTSIAPAVCTTATKLRIPDTAPWIGWFMEGR